MGRSRPGSTRTGRERVRPVLIVERLDGSEQMEVRDLTPSEFQTYQASHAKLKEFELSLKVIDIPRRNFNELTRCLDGIDSDRNDKISGLNVSSKEWMEEAAQDLNTRMINYLTSFRLYLDHKHARLVREYGKDSHQVQHFSSWTSLAFDNEFAYRFIYKLRNYVQHVGMPVGDLVVHGKANPPGSGNIDYSVDFSLRPHRLLAEYDSWGKVKHDLVGMNGNIDVRQVVRTSYAALRQIEEQTVVAEAKPLHDAGNALMNVISDAFMDGWMPSVAEIQEKGKTTKGLRRYSMSRWILPMDVLTALGFVSIDGDTISYTYYEVEDPPGPA